MVRLSHLAFGAAVASALHIPSQQHLAEPVAPEDDARPFINTEALQKTISRDRLWKRAEKLYEIAKESEHDFGHPTRVIGSKGSYLCKFVSVLCLPS